MVQIEVMFKKTFQLKTEKKHQSLMISAKIIRMV